MHWETKKFVSLLLFRYSLYCGGLESNLQYRLGLPASIFIIPSPPIPRCLQWTVLAWTSCGAAARHAPLLPLRGLTGISDSGLRIFPQRKAAWLTDIPVSAGGSSALPVAQAKVLGLSLLLPFSQTHFQSVSKTCWRCFQNTSPG